MKSWSKGFLSGMLVMLLMVGSVSVYASGGINSAIEVVLNKVNIAVDGQKLASSGESYRLDNGDEVPFSILYKGTTYLPIRKVSEIISKEIGWDGTTSTVILGEQKLPEKESVSKINLTNNPSIVDLRNAISSIPTIIEIGIVTEDNDPNGNLGKQGGYTGALFFTDKNAPEVDGPDPIEKGTVGGGSIEVYANVSDAMNRDSYLAAFDGGMFSSGSHKVVGTLVIRTSSELTASQQRTLEQQIIDALQ